MRTNYQLLTTAVLAVAFLLFLPNAYLQADTTYNDGGIHNIDTIMPAGTVYLNNGSTANVISGGSVTGGTNVRRAFGIFSDNGSKVNIYDGTITGGTGDVWSEGIVAINNTSLNIHGGSITGGTGTWGNGVDVTGGSTAYIYAGNISGGAGSWADGIDIVEGSIVSIFGGNIRGGNGTYWAYGVFVKDNSMLNIYGGTFTAGSVESAKDIYAIDNSTIKIYGSDFNYGFGPVSDISGIITGVLSDGTLFNNSFEQQYAGQIVLLQIPEPVSLALFGLGGLAVLRNRRQ